MEHFLNVLSSKTRETGENRENDSHEIVTKQSHVAPDIQQGLEYLSDIHNMCSSLQQSATLIEHFTSMEKSSGPTIESEEKKEMQQLKKLEDRFNKLLSEYSTVYKNYALQIQRSLQEDSNTYNNKTIMTPDGSGYYVNGFGIARFWSGKAWDNRSSTCPSVTHISTNDIQSLGLTKGRPMEEGEPCGYEGTNIRVEQANKTTNAGYVDESNRLRPYQSVDMTNNTSTCPTDVQTILSSDWNAFTRGEPMTESTLCNLGKVDMKDKRELEDINRQLLETANEVYEKIQGLREKYKSYNEISSAQEEALQKQLGKYRHMYKKIKKISDNDTKIQAMTEDSHLLYKSSHLKFIMWSLLSGLLIIYAIKQIRK